MSYLLIFATWLSKCGLTSLVTRDAWLVPALQVVHILAIAAIIIVAVVINLRVLGLVERQYPLREVVSRYFPIIWIALGILAVTGALLIASEPYRALFRTAFWVKMGLIVIAVAATAASRGRFARLAHVAKTGWPVDGGIRRFLAVLALLAWAGVIFFGRWIAYADPWPGAPG
ncbi:DUF6644 family protein [uncultured Sphingomonas sp.]|uniref:DUF6644 family protein n=1 Tax=uncultured Sphingomonas sp. TaxID=158754 RepID=UPI0035CC6ACC